MTRDDDFIGHLEGYLDEYEGGTPLPNEVRDAIRAQLPSTQQRPAWWPGWRFPEMNNFVKLGLAAAGVAVAALLGFNYLVAPNIGGPGPDLTTDPTPTPSPLGTLAGQDPLEPGTYFVVGPDPDMEVTITVPEGWAAFGGWALVGPDGSGPPGGVGLGFWDVRNLYVDPTQPTLGFMDPAVGPSVDDLANALANHPSFASATAPRDVTVDGYAGKEVEITIPDDIAVSDCSEPDMYLIWSDATGGERCSQGPGQSEQIVILDVDGFRLVFDAVYFPDTPEALRAELDAVVDSIQIEP